MRFVPPDVGVARVLPIGKADEVKIVMKYEPLDAAETRRATTARGQECLGHGSVAKLSNVTWWRYRVTPGCSGNHSFSTTVLSCTCFNIVDWIWKEPSPFSGYQVGDRNSLGFWRGLEWRGL